MEIDFWVGRWSSSQRVDATWKRQLSGFATSVELATVGVHSPNTHAAAERPAVGDVVFVAASHPRLAAMSKRGMPTPRGCGPGLHSADGLHLDPDLAVEEVVLVHSSRGRWLTPKARATRYSAKTDRTVFVTRSPYAHSQKSPTVLPVTPIGSPAEARRRCP